MTNHDGPNEHDPGEDPHAERPRDELARCVSDHVESCVRQRRASYGLPDDPVVVQAQVRAALGIAGAKRLVVVNGVLSSKAQAHLKRHAVIAVDRQIVKMMLADPDSPLWTLNDVWLAKCVCRLMPLPIKYAPLLLQGAFSSYDHLSNEQVEQVFHASQIFAETSKDVWRGLAGFRLVSNFDTWRKKLAVNAKTRYFDGIEDERENEDVFSSLENGRCSDDGDERTAFECTSRAPSPEDLAAIHELLDGVQSFGAGYIKKHPQDGPILDMLIYQGMKPGEIAKALGLDSQHVYNRISEFHKAARSWRRSSYDRAGAAVRTGAPSAPPTPPAP